MLNNSKQKITLNKIDALIVVTLIIIAGLVLTKAGYLSPIIKQEDADKKTGAQTLVNTYGVKKAAFISLPFMFFPFAMIPLLIDSGVLGSYLWLLTLLTIPSFLVFYQMIREKKGCRFLENTSAWAMMYATYFVFAFGFSVLTIFGSVVA